VAFVVVTAVTAVVLNVAFFVVAAETDRSGYAPTECGFDEIECGGVPEFAYDDTAPLVPLLLVVPAALVGWLAVRAMRGSEPVERRQGRKSD